MQAKIEIRTGMNDSKIEDIEKESDLNECS